MVLTRCAFCTHSNPSGARFCNECGSPLHLRPCEHCEAVNDVLERACYRCGAPMRVERRPEPIVARDFANVRDAARDWEMTTVAAAYGEEAGEEARASTRSIEARRDGGEGRESQAMHDDAAALDAATAPRRAPFADTVAPDDDADRRVTHRAKGSRRHFLTLVAGVAIIGLAALGGYTFLQRRAPASETPPTPAAAPVSPTSEMSATPASPASLEPTPSDATAPRDAPAPAPQNTSRSDADPSSAFAPDAVREIAPAAANGGGAASQPKGDRRPAPLPKASPDAIETQRIITRELGGFAPPPTR